MLMWLLPYYSKGEKGDKESIMKEALANAKLWESRYVAVDKSRQEYRDNTKKLVGDNERLQTAVNQVRVHADTILIYYFWVHS